MTAKTLLATAISNATPVYVEDVFSTYLYEGTSASLEINNGLDLAAKGGMTWIKQRTGFTTHNIYDSERGVNLRLDSSTTNAQATPSPTDFASFDADGFTLGTNGTSNSSATPYASWSFRNCPGFFYHEEVTKSASSDATVDLSSLGTVGMVAVKRTDSAGSWFVWHRSATAGDLLYLEQTAAETLDGSITVSGTTLTLEDGVIADGTYIVYAWAHDEQIFGDNSDESIIKCGSYTGNGTNNEISLGWEPQYILIKNTDVARGWFLFDTMRGLPTGSTFQRLSANDSSAEATGAANTIDVNADGFALHTADIEYNRSGDTYIYIAIRRPMKTPASVSEVFEATAYTGNQTANRQIGSNFPVDLVILSDRDAASNTWATFGHYVFSRLIGENNALATASNAAESSGWATYINFARNDGYDLDISGNQDYLNDTGTGYVSYAFKRATGFFDVVCYEGTGSAHAETHNLGVVPELIIVKNRDAADAWAVYAGDETDYLVLNTTAATADDATYWNDTAPTSTQFTVGTQAVVNTSGESYVAYLFATLAGISKVGSYTGTAANIDVDCGFSTGARFILIKRTDFTGDWYLWDSTRGIVAGNDPYLLLNSTAAETTTTDYIDPDSSGFVITSSAPAALNASGGEYIFLAIAAE